MPGRWVGVPWKLPACQTDPRLYSAANSFRRGGRAAEGARLESVYTGNRIEGSNPSPSANKPPKPLISSDNLRVFSFCPNVCPNGSWK